MSIERNSTRIAQLLNERVASSIAIFAVVLGWGHAGVLLLTALAYLGAPKFDFFPVFLNSLANIVIAIVIYRLVRNRRNIAWIGAALAGGSALFTAQCLVLSYLLFHDNPSAYLVLAKGVGPLAGLLAAAGMGFTLRPLYVAIAGAGSVVTLLVGFFIAWRDGRTVFELDGVASMLSPSIDPVWFTLQVLFMFLGTAAIFFATVFARRTVYQAAQLQKTADNLSRFFSPNVAADIQRSDRDIMEVGGEDRQIVVLFSDLAGFTAVSAGMAAREVLAMLSAYQERMVEAIFNQGGTLDKFIGDGIMAIFGAPTDQPDAADRAVRAALGMTAALAALNLEREAQGQPALTQRIGIHAGTAIVGNVGTSRRLEFTAIGDTVNIASRIEAACKVLRQPILVSQPAVALLQGRYDLAPQPSVELRGVSRGIGLYAVMA